MEDQSIKVMIVDDSRSTAMFLAHRLDCFKIVGIAENGEDALRMNAKLKPDVITMDINLPDMNGLELTRQILEHRSVGIIVVSALLSPDRQELVFEALQAGAYDAIAKSKLLADESSPTSQKLMRLVRSAARRRQLQSETPAEPAHSFAPTPFQAALQTQQRQVVAMGAATGGPAALREVLSALKSNFKAPVLVAQHMTDSFSLGLVKWLNAQTPLKVCTAENGQTLEPASVYFAPNGYHLTVSTRRCIKLHSHRGEQGPCPSVNLLFQSVALAYGNQALCLLMTGMGTDGARGLLTAKEHNCLTAVQDEASSVAFGMPQQALQLGATRTILPLPKIASWLALQI